MAQPGSAVIGSDGERGVDAWFDEVYTQLKQLAGRQLARAAAGATLDTTALVHELYLRIAADRELSFAHRGQFFTYAARALRHLLINRARDRLRFKAGGDWVRVTFTAGIELVLESAEQAVALDAALDRLAQADARAAQVVELRYFAGLPAEQVAELLGLSKRTVDRDWRYARAFLQSRLGSG